ncbi:MULTISPECIES: nickel ABC transporter permease [Neobacillus]|uniref:Nickel import system permease protein NikB n=2 Tax=Neobacillus TaxID=2675232 RepID=A0A942U7J5_9BACI|nr:MULTISPECIES: nickel ABC transporter permease [Neobacillus]MBS4213851.1 ABC transporter permease [Neobacillus rhizophilus]MBU8917745.1 ABC transporter permease [Bacillus sp. FJAT-29953]MCH6268033.1 ABC transporter permease [Neobacillus citreus]
MIAYVIRRLLHTVLVVFAISLLIFFSIRLTGDPVTVMFSAGEPTKEAIEEVRRNLGLDQPLYVQYLIFLKGLVTFDFGESFRSHMPVMDLIMERAGATLALAIGGTIVSILIAFPVGIISAVKRGSIVDFFGRIFSLIGISFPNFWLGIMLILIFAVNLKWLPSSGFEGPQHLILPSITLGMILSGILARLVRSSMLEVMNQQYVSTAKSKGISDWAVIIKHAFRNALLPTITFLGLQFGSLLGGTVIVETIFSWPGIGRLIIDAINQRDYPVIQGGVIFLAVIMVVVNLIVDLSYSLIDPRIKTGGSGRA